MKRTLFIMLLSVFTIFTTSCDEATIAALTEAATQLLEKTEGCMNEDNAKFNVAAVIHNADSCAVQIYGCTDATALNYNATATNLCQGIDLSLCCTASVAGCTDANYQEYNEDANEDDGSCATAVTFGCMSSSACNYNPNATSDCNKKAGGENTNCCVMGSTTETVCAQDNDNDGFVDAGTESQTLAAGNCGCETIGFGWKNQEDTNGQVIWGCLDPACPEYNPDANRNNYECCLTLTAVDSLFMYGEDYETCAADTDGDGLPNLENCIQTDDFSMLGGYKLDFSQCDEAGGPQGGPDDHHEEAFIFLGYDGEYYEEFLSIHELKGFRAPPMYLSAYDNPKDCESYAKDNGNANWFCANQMANVEEYRPCEEEIFAGDCDMWIYNQATDNWVENPNGREECWWESPECRWKPNAVLDACWQEENQASQSACTADPGCQWDDGGFADYGSVMWEPYCYFDCWGQSEANCAEHTAADGTFKGNSALNAECMWKTPDANDGYCVAPSVPANCVKMDGTVDVSSTTPNTCWQAGHMWEAGNCVKSDGTVDTAIKSGPACWNAGHEWQDQWMACNELGVSGTSGNCVGDPAKTTKQACETGTCKKPDGMVDSSITTEQACWDAGYWWDWPMGWWDSGPSDCNGYEDWETGAFVCECNVPPSATAATDCAAKCTGCEWKAHGEAQCEWKQIVDACNSYDNPAGCNGAPATENCEWDMFGNWCFKAQGADCWELDSATCQSNSDCEWFIPPGYTPLPVSSPWYGLADEGVCHFFDWCNDFYCYEGECDQQGCKGDEYCKWEERPGQPKTCVEDKQAQYCECHVEWSESACTSNSNSTWDAMHHECMYNMDEAACYSGEDLMLGPEDGNIDCDAYLPDNVYHYTEWNASEGVCEDIFEDSMEGIWSLDGQTLCIDTGDNDLEEEDCSDLYFEECQCNLHRCHWSPAPTQNNPDAGTCGEGSMNPGGGTTGGRVKVQGVDHYKIKTVASRFQNEQIYNYLYGNPPDDCMSFELKDNGDIHVTIEKDGGGTCNVILKPFGDDS